MIKVTFANDANSVTLDYVRNVSWQISASTDLFTSTTNAQNQLVKSVTVRGYINQGIWENNVQAQQQLETDLRTVSLGSIQYPGLTDVEDARFTSLEFDEFRGNPLAEYTIQFETQADNIHAHTPVQIGSQVLSLAEGFIDIQLKDSLKAQGDDETINILKSRSFKIMGSIVGATLSEVNGNAQKIEVALKDQQNVTLTLSDGSSGSTYTVRPESIDISSPTVRDQSTSRTFTVALTTYDDYTKEPYTLGETQQTFGTIQWDVVDTVDHKYSFETATTNVNAINTETLSVSGKKYFNNWTEYNTTRDTFHPEASLPPYLTSASSYEIGSISGASLTLRSLAYGTLSRDGNDPTTDAKRYSSSLQGTWEFVPTKDQSSIASAAAGGGTSHIYLGQTFDTISSISPSVQLDESGNVVSRSASVSGSVLVTASAKQSTIESVLALRGTRQQLNSSLADDTDYYISSVNISSVETEFLDSVENVRISISISGSKLDTATQAKYFISRAFSLGNFQTGNTPTGPTLDNITSLSKSFSYASFNSEERVESISIACSGEVWQADDGNGAPLNPNVNIELFNKLDRTLRAPFSTAPSGEGSDPSPDPGGNVLHQIQSGESWTINSINISQWTPFIKPNQPSTVERHWKQTISLSVKVVYDITGISGGASGSAPVSVVTLSSSITDPSPKFVQLQVAGFGTVFKRVGTNPGKAVMTAEKSYRDTRVFDPSASPPDPEDPGNPSGGGTYALVKTSEDRRNLVLRKVKEYIQDSS